MFSPFPSVNKTEIKKLNTGHINFGRDLKLAFSFQKASEVEWFTKGRTCKKIKSNLLSFCMYEKPASDILSLVILNITKRATLYEYK